MKKISSYISAILLGVLALQSCDDNWTRPPMDVPTFPAGTKANTTIADLKAQYWQSSDSYGTTIGRTADGDSVIIVGTVVSSDESGNIYKLIVVQDETSAITIGIDTTSIYEQIPTGVAVAINATGLTIGKYSGLMQMGIADGSGVNRMPYWLLESRTIIDFSAGKVDTTTVTIPELLEASKTTEGQVEWQSKLIRIDNVKFKEAGEGFTTGSTTSRYIVDDAGNSMIVYNSSYSSFAYDKLPYGHGSVVGILSCYRTAWQLLLIDEASCIDFDGEGAPDPNLETVFKEDFGALSQGDFTIDNILLGEGLSYVWEPTDKYGMKASAFANSTCIESDSRLISPVIDLTNYHTPILQFHHCCNKFASLDNAKAEATLEVRAEGGEWTKVTIPEYSTNDSWTYVDSGDIDLSAFAGKKIQFAFHYTSSAASAGTWEVENVVLTAIKK